AMRLEANLDRFRAGRLCVAHEARRHRQACRRTRTLERAAPRDLAPEQAPAIAFSSHASSPFFEHWPNVQAPSAPHRTGKIACVQTRSPIREAGNRELRACRPA